MATSARKLTAILSADVVGYAALMERDETGTLGRLKEDRTALVEPCISSHGGRIFKLMGDGMLAEFPSVVAAVNCALDIQRAMAGKESELPEVDRLRYRIGVNLGDVLVEGDEFYGDGVNIAARLQALAPTGGIAVSRIVADQVRGKVDTGFDDLGSCVVKANERPIQVYTARLEASAPPAIATAEPYVSICVLPFDNMSGDAEHEYFSDGISEDIITDLSKVSALKVTARTTAFGFKKKNPDLRQLARQLNVGFVLEGSVRRSAERVRISAQLIEASTGNHLWAERYDRELREIFSLQDEIAEAIVAALKVRLLPEEKKEIERRGTNDLEAYNHYLMARQFGITGNVGRTPSVVLRLCNKAIEIDPSYADAWALIARTQFQMHFYLDQGSTGWEAAERAIELDDKAALAYAVKARILLASGRIEEGLEQLQIALSLSPQTSDVDHHAAMSYYSLRRMEEAIVHWEKFVALEEDEYADLAMLVSAYLAVGDAQGARHAAQRCVERCEKVLTSNPDNGSAIGYLVTALAVLGEGERVKSWVERGMLLDPNNHNMRYNFACTFAQQLHDADACFEYLGPYLEQAPQDAITHVKTDPDLDGVRDDPRFLAMIEAAEKRLAEQTSKAS